MFKDRLEVVLNGLRIKRTEAEVLDDRNKKDFAKFREYITSEIDGVKCDWRTIYIHVEDNQNGFFIYLSKTKTDLRNCSIIIEFDLRSNKAHINNDFLRDKQENPYWIDYRDPKVMEWCKLGVEELIINRFEKQLYKRS